MFQEMLLLLPPHSPITKPVMMVKSQPNIFEEVLSRLTQQKDCELKEKLANIYWLDPSGYMWDYIQRMLDKRECIDVRALSQVTGLKTHAKSLGEKLTVVGGSQKLRASNGLYCAGRSARIAIAYSCRGIKGFTEVSMPECLC